MNSATRPSTLVLALVTLAAAGCSRGHAAVLPVRSVAAPSGHADLPPPGQVPLIALDKDARPRGIVAGPLSVVVTDAYLQHWIGDQWMLSASVEITNRSTTDQPVNAETVTVAGASNATAMTGFAEPTLTPGRGVSAELIWAGPFAGVPPRALTINVPGPEGMQSVVHPVRVEVRSGNAAHVTSTVPSRPGRASIAPATPTGETASQVGFFDLLRDELTRPRYAITLGSVSVVDPYGEPRIRLGLIIENISGAPITVPSGIVDAMSNGVTLALDPGLSTPSTPSTLQPGERATGLLAFIPSRAAGGSASGTLEVLYGELNSRGQRPFRQTFTYGP